MPMIGRKKLFGLGLSALLAVLGSAPARADLMLSELIVELQPGKQIRDDIEVWNSSPERSYVAVEPREILNPGTAAESIRKDPDPEKLGLLVTPTRMVLEPGQRKIVRVALLASAVDRERVYRVTVKPVIGELDAHETGLKILVGYDVLVLVRPTAPVANLVGVRAGHVLTFTNHGNVSVELVDGRQCDSSRAHCTDLPGKRLYAGAVWSETLSSDLPVEYDIREPSGVVRRTF